MSFSFSLTCCSIRKLKFPELLISIVLFYHFTFSFHFQFLKKLCCIFLFFPNFPENLSNTEISSDLETFRAFFRSNKPFKFDSTICFFYIFHIIHIFLFFAAYVLCKSYSFNRVVFLLFSFFFRPKLPTLYSKINDSSRVRTTGFSSSRFGVRVCDVPKIFAIFPQHFLMPEISETVKGSFMMFFGTVRQKIFDGNL